MSDNLIVNIGQSRNSSKAMIKAFKTDSYKPGPFSNRSNQMGSNHCESEGNNNCNI